MGVAFRREIKWPYNELYLPPDLFAVTVPAGLSENYVRYPKIVDTLTMMQLSKSSNVSRSGSLAIVDGLVKPDLKVRFANPMAQWRRTALASATAGHGPFEFKFLGGEVVLEFNLAIYLSKVADYDPKDDLSVQIFATLYEHELLHVLDEVDIFNNWLPPRLNTEPTIQTYLVQGQPYVYGTRAMVAGQADKDFQTFIENTIQVAVFNLWATESNRREALRDAPAQYKLVQDKVDNLRQRQINRPHR